MRDGERGDGAALGAILARASLLDFLEPLHVDQVEIAAHADNADTQARQLGKAGYGIEPPTATVIKK